MAGGDSASSSTSRGQVYCQCGGLTVIRTVKNGPNAGRKFHGCPKWPKSECDFMGFVDKDSSIQRELDDLRLRVFEKDVTISELEYHQQKGEDKIKKLQLKKASLEAENKQLKREKNRMEMHLMRASTNGKFYSIALFVSWVFFGVVMMLKR